MAMTSQQARQAANDYRFSMRWLSDWQEFRVTLPDVSKERQEAIAYYTDDREDAVLTGIAMRRAEDKLNADKARTA